MPWPAPASLKVTNTALAGAPTGNAPAMRSRTSVRRAARSPMGGAVHSPIHADGGSGPSPCTFPSASTTCATPSQPTAPPRSGLVPRPAHSDVRVTLGTYAHLLVEDLCAAADAHAPLPAMPAQQIQPQ